MIKNILVFITFALMGTFAHAEYRVFILHIENSKTNVTREIQSTLDPEQFKTLFPLNLYESISYVDTWMCKGRTDLLKPHCDRSNSNLKKSNNLDRNLDRNPAATTSQSPELIK